MTTIRETNPPADEPGDVTPQSRRLRPRRTAWRRLSAVALAAVAAGLFCALVPRERLLLREARRITSVSAPLLSSRIWLSDHEAALMRYHADGDRFELVNCDTSSDIETPFRAFNSSLAPWLLATNLSASRHMVSPQPANLKVAPPYAISPDGRLVSLTAIILHPDVFPQCRISIFSIGEDRLIARKWTGDSWQYWLPDSRRLIGRDTAFGQTHSAVRMHGPSNSGPGDSVAGISVGNHERWLGLSAAGGLLTVSQSDRSARRILVCEYPLSAGGSPSRKRVQLPDGARFAGGSVSTRGDRIGWVFRQDRTPRAAVWLHRHLPQYTLHTVNVDGLWVSRLDGSDMTEVGHIEMVPGAYREEERLSSVEWLPGDRQLSFTYRNGLYTVPVPRD